MARKIVVTTPLPYANGSLHIGHIMEYIQADIWVRVQRMQGHELHFICADDAHGAPIMLKAEAEGITPQQLIARVAAERPRYLKGFGRARERRAVAGYLRASEAGRPHLFKAGRAVL